LLVNFLLLSCTGRFTTISRCQTDNPWWPCVHIHGLKSVMQVMMHFTCAVIYELASAIKRPPATFVCLLNRFEYASSRDVLSSMSTGARKAYYMSPIPFPDARAISMSVRVVAWCMLAAAVFFCGRALFDGGNAEQTSWIDVFPYYTALSGVAVLLVIRCGLCQH
jgi:hypothetical protein